MTRLFALALSLLVAAGCAHKAPMKTRLHDGDEQARTLLILLPGFGARYTTLDKRGIVQAARDAGFDGDILAADLTYGYYVSNTWDERMREDVFAAYADNYDHIWVLGISMGGMGTLLTTKWFTEQVDGAILLSPFLGRRRTVRDLQEVGLDAYQPPGEGEPVWDEALWMWMKGWEARDWTHPILFLGHGDRDLGMRNLEWMGGLMPAERVEVVPGGHTWPVWAELTRLFIRDHLLGKQPGFGGREVAPLPTTDPGPDTAADDDMAGPDGMDAEPGADPSDADTDEAPADAPTP